MPDDNRYVTFNKLFLQYKDIIQYVISIVIVVHIGNVFLLNPLRINYLLNDDPS